MSDNDPDARTAHGAGRTVADLGEEGVIAAATRRVTADPRVPVGPGDDAAVVLAPDGRVVVSSDAVVEGRHFRFDLSTPEHVGRRVIAQNAADIAAMGAVCTAFTVTLGCPADTAAEVIERLSEGIAAGAAAAGGAVVGGDVVRTDQVIVSVTVLGDLAGRAPVLLSGARPGDVLAVCGTLGHSAAGLAALEARDAECPEVVAVYRVPEPPLAAGPTAADAGATAMTDVSDGLVRDARAIAMASRVTVDLDPAALDPQPGAPHPDPLLARAASRRGAAALDWVLTGGEDHALLATFPPDVVLPKGFRRIGRVLAGEPGVTVADEPAPERGGWTSFVSNEE
ncbi:thiamine-phosphate kinase [Tsukamurella soli]|uniref:Thiamine-monophosphate kinase n=1 Tax=Tsukamurella soli TaxID=644556 RepID=A0ABP8JVH7_9ACTN